MCDFLWYVNTYSCDIIFSYIGIDLFDWLGLQAYWSVVIKDAVS